MPNLLRPSCWDLATEPGPCLHPSTLCTSLTAALCWLPQGERCRIRVQELISGGKGDPRWSRERFQGWILTLWEQPGSLHLLPQFPQLRAVSDLPPLGPTMGTGCHRNAAVGDSTG